MQPETVINLSNISKCYQIYDNPKDRFKQFIIPRLTNLLGMERKDYCRQFWALKNISFDIKRGETLGLIGKNGSGKSTLLQIISGVLTPTEGTIVTQGRIAALLELGSGFNVEFTGRENVYMNAAILGLDKSEIDEKFEKIAAFADIGRFMDQPVKMYSSGMLVRLAFSVQAQIDPDILIVDEALAVGDAKFQAKCFEHIKSLKDKGTSILLVTHSTEQIVTHCDRAVLLNDGVMLEMGIPRKVVNSYLDLLFGKERKKIATHSPRPDEASEFIAASSHAADLSSKEEKYSLRNGYNPHEYRWGDGQAEILDYHLSADGIAYPSTIVNGQKIAIEFSIKLHDLDLDPIFGITIKTKEGITIYGTNSEMLAIPSPEGLVKRNGIIIIRSEFTAIFAPGDYFLSVGVATRKGEDIIPHDRRYDSIHLQVQPSAGFFGLVDLDLGIEIKDMAA